MKPAYSQRFFGARAPIILKLQKLYGQKYFEDKKRNEKHQIMYQQEFERLKRYFDLNQGGKVLDIGCGTGDFLLLFGSKWEKYGIEISPFARKVASQKGIVTNFKLRDDFFNLIIFRGTLQHIPDPINRIGECYYWLKDGGNLVFLATPNINSVYYKLFNTLPMLAEAYNFLLPSDLMLRQILKNFGFKIKGFEYPYRCTPYARPVRDLFSFLLKFFWIKRKVKFPFYRNLMECYAVKETQG